MSQISMDVCDLHIEEQVAALPVEFELDGESYVIDLCKAHHRQLGDDLEHYVRRARHVAGPIRARRRRK